MNSMALKHGKDMLYLAACALHGRLPEKKYVENMDLRRLYKMAKFHNLQSIVYISLTNYIKEQGGDQIDSEALAGFAADYQRTVKKIVMFDLEREALTSFIGRESWYVCLKGVVLQNYYPKMGMRQMADNDILVDPAFAPKIREYLVERGYSVESYGKGVHDTYFRGMMNFEIHRKLFSSAAKTRLGSDYYGRVKNMLLPGARPGELVFSDDDFYVYFMYHAYKHYATAGCGVRTLMDIFVYRSKNDRLRPEYIARELNRLGIREYEENSRRLAFILFDPDFTPEGEIPAELCQMLEYYLTSGTFGTSEKLVDNNLSDVAQGGRITTFVKLKYLLRRVFPDMNYYREAHPKAYKWIIPIPFLWLKRIFRGFTKTKTIASEVNKLKEK